MSDIIALAHALAEEDSSRGFLHYLRHCLIDSRPEPARFSAVAHRWQWEWAATLAPALEDVTGVRPGYTGPRCFWRTLARGHDKTTGLARAVNYALAFGKRPIQIDAGAADAEQAQLLLAAMAREAELNPWLKRRIVFRRGRVTGPGGELVCLTSDAPTAAGRIPDIVICDEVTHWESRALWDMLFSGANKRPATLVLVITNAGIKESWQWDIKETAKGQPARWKVYEAPGRLNTWMSEENLAYDRQLLTPSEARRLLDNEWIDPAEESGYLSPADIDACEELGCALGLTYALRAEHGHTGYWASTDYGPKKDRTALAIVHQRPSGLLTVDRLDVWQGSREAPVEVADVRAWVKAARDDFPGLAWVTDPYQLLELAQDLRHVMRVEEWEARGGKSNYAMAECLRSLVVNRGIAWYPGAGSLPVAEGKVETLRDELRHLVTRPMSYGYRIDHESTKHDDRAVAVGMAAAVIMRGAGPASVKIPKPPERPVPAGQRREKDRAGERGLYGVRG